MCHTKQNTVDVVRSNVKSIHFTCWTSSRIFVFSRSHLFIYFVCYLFILFSRAATVTASAWMAICVSPASPHHLKKKGPRIVWMTAHASLSTKVSLRNIDWANWETVALPPTHPSLAQPCSWPSPVMFHCSRTFEYACIRTKSYRMYIIKYRNSSSIFFFIYNFNSSVLYKWDYLKQLSSQKWFRKTMLYRFSTWWALEYLKKHKHSVCLAVKALARKTTLCARTSRSSAVAGTQQKCHRHLFQSLKIRQ